MSDATLSLVMFTMTVCGIAGMVVGGLKGELLGGFLLGFFFGPLGLIFLLASQGQTPCPYCGEKVRRGAAVCTHCSSVISSAN